MGTGMDDAQIKEMVRARYGGIAELTDLLRKQRHEHDTLEKCLKRTEMEWDALCALSPPLAAWNGRPEVRDQVVLEAKYSGYIDRQAAQVERFQRMESRPIPQAARYMRPAIAEFSWRMQI